MKKYEIVEGWIKTGLQTGRFLPGDQLPSESQLSSELSVARNSVRQALSNLNAQGYVETRQGIGTFCLAPGHSTSGSRDIGLLCFATSSYIFPELVSGVQTALNRAGYHLLVNQTDFDLKTEREMLLSFRQRGIAGLILEPVFAGDGLSNADVLGDLVQTGVPVVLVDNSYSDGEFTAIVMDDAAGGILSASYLYERGHREIAVTFDRDYLPKIRRKDAMLGFLESRDITVPSEWQLSYCGPHTSLKLQDQAIRCLADSSNHPTAFCCSSDEEAMDVVAAAESLGLRVPEDVSVVGFDNSASANHGRVALTTIDHPTRYMGELATTLLIQGIRHPEVDNRSINTIRPRMIERKSVRDLRSLDWSSNTG